VGLVLRAGKQPRSKGHRRASLRVERWPDGLECGSLSYWPDSVLGTVAADSALSRMSCVRGSQLTSQRGTRWLRTAPGPVDGIVGDRKTQAGQRPGAFHGLGETPSDHPREAQLDIDALPGLERL
jgi:hypothetical protein